MSENLQQLNIMVEPSIKAQVIRLAKKRKASVSYVAREAIDVYLASLKKKK